MEEPLPVGLALILCETFDRTPSGRLNLGGLLHNIKGEAYPLVLPRLCVYAALTDIRPRCRCKLDIVDGDTDEPLLRGVEFDVPRVQEAMGTSVFELAIDFTPFPFPNPGTFLVRLFTNEQLLLQRCLLVE